MVELLNKKIKVYIKISDDRTHFYFGRVTDKDENFITIFDNKNNNYRMLNFFIQQFNHF